MSNKNPATMLAESLADFSKAAYQVFTETENHARQEVAHAVAEAREARIERDKAMKELRVIQLESQSWKEDAASSRAALTQAEMTIAQQAENLVTQLETITQLRRELNQWKDQARNWQEHFLRVEEERCTQSSRIDEFIMQKLEKFQYSARPGPSTNAFITPKTSKQVNQINSAPSSVMTKLLASPRPPAYRPNAESATPEESKNATLVQTSSNVNSTNVSLPTPESGSRRPKPKSQTSQHHGAPLTGSIEKPSNGRKPRRSNGDNHAPETSSAQPNSHQQALSAPSNIRSSTVIRRVEAVITVKREEDGVDESNGAARSSPATDTVFVKRRNEETQGNAEHSRKRLVNKRGTALISDNEENEVGSEEEENRGTEGGMYKFRRTSRINYREEDEEEEEDDELMMGAEANRDELFDVHPVDQSRQQAAVAPPPKKRRKYSLR